MVLLTREGSTEAVDTPLASRSFPRKDTVFHFIGQVDGLLYWSICGRCGEF